MCITADLVAPVLQFMAEISKESVMKDWLGSPEGSIFWPTLFNLLCNTLTNQPGPQQLHTHKTKVGTLIFKVKPFQSCQSYSDCNLNFLVCSYLKVTRFIFLCELFWQPSVFDSSTCKKKSSNIHSFI